MTAGRSSDHHANVGLLDAARILLVSPSTDLRRSLAFALETDGYIVTSHGALVGPDSARDYDAVVLDHKAATTASREQVLEFCLAVPVILLAGTPQPWLTPSVTRVVPTPILGDALSAAMRAVVPARNSPK